MDPNFPSATSNVTSAGGIPAGRRRRLVLVAAVALVAGSVAAAAVIATRGGGTHHPPAAKPLGGSPPLVLELPGPAVKGGNAAVAAAARKRLPAGDVRLAVARAILAYDPARRALTVAALQRLPQGSPVVVFELGLAELWAGDPQTAERTLNQVKRLNPYGFYGTNADNLLHLESEVPGYPPYFPPTSEQRSLAALRRAVHRSPTSPAAWLALAAGLERSDRLAALRAARRAAGLDPTGVSEQVAVAVLGFSKDHPAASVGILGTLASQTQTQQNPEVRFHLGLLFFWIRERQDAAGEFRQVQQDAPGSTYAKIAHVFESCIDSPAACAALEQKG
jgi:tetratricopeptide (TPR) repeat protein